MKIFNFLKSENRTKISFFFVGIASLIWFLVRVIPKPSRATYPCMKAAAPIMSGFIVYLLTFWASVFAFKKAREKYLKTKYWTAVAFSITAIIATAIFFANDVQNIFANTSQTLAVLENPILLIVFSIT